jgi:hypothetical protein
MLPGRIIGGSSANTDRLLLDDEPVVVASSIHTVQPSTVTLPTPPRDGGRSPGFRDPRSDLFGNIRPLFSVFTIERVYSTANAHL